MPATSPSSSPYFQPERDPSLHENLLDAVSRDFLPDVKDALARGAEVDGPPGADTVPLILALRLGSYQAAELLLGRGANPDAKNRHGNSALHVAIEVQALCGVELMLAAGARCDATNARGQTATRYAETRPELHALILAHEAAMQAARPGQSRPRPFRSIAQPVPSDSESLLDILDPSDWPGTAALETVDIDAVERSVQNLEPGQLQAMLDVGRLPTSYGATLSRLMCEAAQGGRAGDIARLAALGADVDRVDDRGLRPIDHAWLGGHDRVVAELQQCGAKPVASALHVYAALGDTGRVWDYLRSARGAEGIYRVDADGRTPLHVAVQRGGEAVANILLHFGASKNAQDGRGDTALHLAAARGDRACMQALLNHQADMELFNHNGCTALHVAAWNNRGEAVGLLLRDGARAETLTEPRAPRGCRNLTARALALKHGAHNAVGVLDGAARAGADARLAPGERMPGAAGAAVPAPAPPMRALGPPSPALAGVRP